MPDSSPPLAKTFGVEVDLWIIVYQQLYLSTLLKKLDRFEMIEKLVLTWSSILAQQLNKDRYSSVRLVPAHRPLERPIPLLLFLFLHGSTEFVDGGVEAVGDILLLKIFRRNRS